MSTNTGSSLERELTNFSTLITPEDLAKVVKFCDKNHIDYLIVDKRNFSREFLEAKRLYFEPFNSYIKNITRDRSRYALLQNLPTLITFQDGNIFVIRVSALAT